MTQYTPTPWKIEEHKYGFFNFIKWRIVGAEHTDFRWQFVADGLEKEDAQFIVKACNMHDKFVALAKRIDSGAGLGTIIVDDETLNLVIGLLAKAEQS